jgi:hypothetical protein
MVKATTKVIWNILKDEYISVATNVLWQQLPEIYFEEFNFFHTTSSALMEIILQCPANSGSKFRNSNQFYLILLSAVVDADWRLISIDVVSPGRHSDG